MSFQDVLTAGLHGSVIILALLLLRPLLRKTGKGLWCLLWLLAFLRLCIPFEIVSSASIQPEPIDWQEIRQLIENNRQAPRNGADFTLPVSDDAAAPNPRGMPVPAETSGEAPNSSWILPVIWLTVASGLTVYAFLSYGHLRWKVREAIRISPGVWESGRIGTAFILGFFLPRIYLPTGLSQENRQYILAHERAHLKRGDHIYKLFAFLTLSVHWFNPLVWVAYRLLCKDIEMACDERVVQEMSLAQRKAYSLALLDCSANHTAFAACPVAFGEISVKERVKSVMRYRKPSLWLSLAGAAAALFVGICLFPSPKPENVAVNPPTVSPTEAPKVTEAVSVGASGQHVNILLVGVKESRGFPLPDAMMLLSLDRETGGMTAASFLPELYVKLPDLWGHKTGQNCMATAYALGYAWQGDSGAREMLGTLIREQFNIAVDYTIEFSSDTVETIVDRLDGADVTLTQQEAEALEGSTEGVNHLEGEAALSYVELALSGETTGAQQASRQRALLIGILDAFRAASASKRQELIRELLPTVLTDIPSETLLSFAAQPPISPVQTIQIPAEGTYQEKDVDLYGDGSQAHVLVPDILANKALLQDLAANYS